MQELMQVLAAIEAELEIKRTRPKLQAKSSANANHSGMAINNLPGWPKRTTIFIRALKAAVEQQVARQMSYDEWSALTGEPKSTLSNWFGGDGNPSVECVLRMFELIPTSQRNHVLTMAPIVRCFPVLAHPKLAHDPAAISRLTTILKQPRGTTLVHGIREDLVTFVVTALGHTYFQQVGSTVRGFDVHTPDWFVPLPAVQHLNNVQKAENIRQACLSGLNSLRTEPSGLVLLNGIWPQVPSFYEPICELASKTAVIIGTSTALTQTGNSIKVPGPAHIITVSPDRTNSDRISMEIQTV
jgi:hypothetical protein